MASGTKFKQFLPSVVISAMCIIAYVTHSGYAFMSGSDLCSHLLFSFCHANIFHLFANLLGLLYFRPRVSTCMVAYVASVAASYIPFVSLSIPTMGLSAFVFAAYARKFYFWSLPLKGVVLSNVIVAFLPYINWRIHVASFFLSYILWMIYDYASVYIKRR